MEMVRLARPARPLLVHSHLRLSRWQSQLEELELLECPGPLRPLEPLGRQETLGLLVSLEPLVNQRRQPMSLELAALW